jgi:ornithine lipid ester-linked acyl 2-hydroxylase
MSSTPKQNWATEGVAPLDRRGFVARVFMAIVRLAERLNLQFAKFGAPCIYDNSTFPWSQTLERDWRKIRAELDRVLVRSEELPKVQDITLDAATITQDAGWKIFVLVAYGVKSPPNIALCPDTWAIVQNIPGLKTAMFSVFEPGKRLPRHRGPYNGVLRLHLGLVVPEQLERLGIRVGAETRHWREGSVLIFDDAYEHEAWNGADRQRVVLFVDFARPLRFPANLLNLVLLNLAAFTPFVREGAANLRQWETRFHRNKTTPEQLTSGAQD